MFLGITYPISGIQVYQIAGTKPFERMTPMTLRRRRYLPLPPEKLKDISTFVITYDKLTVKKEVTKRLDKIISYYLRGCNLEEYWLSESFLNFFKVIELISSDFVKSFNGEIISQLKNTLLSDLTAQEINGLLNEKRLIDFMHKKLGITEKFDIKKIVRLRHEFSAHARIEETTITKEEFNICKCLAGQAIMKYVEQFSY